MEIAYLKYAEEKTHSNMVEDNIDYIRMGYSTPDQIVDSVPKMQPEADRLMLSSAIKSKAYSQLLQEGVL